MGKMKIKNDEEIFLSVHDSIFDRIKNTGYGIVRIGYNSDCANTSLNAIRFLSRLKNKRQKLKIKNWDCTEVINAEVSGIVWKCCYGFPIRNIYKL